MNKKIICLSGKMQNGKSTLANLLKTELTNSNLNYKISIDAFANELKKYCSEDFELLMNYLNNFSDCLKANINVMYNITDYNLEKQNININVSKMIESLKLNKDNFFENKTDISRILLQCTGTDILRNRVDKDFWAKKLKEKILKTDYDFILIQDCRLPNEIEIFSDVKDYEVVAIRVERNIPTNSNKHESETALDDWTSWNYIVDNNGSLQDLQNSAKNIVEDLLKNT